MSKVLGWILIFIGWAIATSPGFDLAILNNEWVSSGASLVMILIGGWQLGKQRVMAVMR